MAFDDDDYFDIKISKGEDIHCVSNAMDLKKML